MTVDNGPEQRLTVQLGGEERASLLRRTRRAAVNGLLVAVDAPELSSDPWVVDAIDINASGLGLVLPPELLEGTEVLLSFRLDEHEFSRLPAVVKALGDKRLHPCRHRRCSCSTRPRSLC